MFDRLRRACLAVAGALGRAQGRRAAVLACLVGLPSFAAPASAAWLIPAPGPRLQYFSGPTYTNLDTIQLIAVFDQDVVNVDVGDFTVSGTTATITSLSQGYDASQYQITISGGDLADLNGEVLVNLASGQDIENLSGNPLTNLATEYGDSPVTVNNTAPVGTFSSSATAPVGGAFSVSLAFTPQDSYADLVVGFESSDLVVTNGTVSNFSVTQTSSSFSVTPAASGTVTIELPAGAYYDEASNPNLASTPFSIEADMEAPTVSSIERDNPSSAYTNGGSLTWLVTFSKRVENVDVTDFVLSGTTASVQSVSPTSGDYTAWEVYVAGGDLASLSTATVTLGFASRQDIEDTFARPLTDTTPTGTNDNTYEVSRVEPQLRDILRHDPVGSPTNADTVTWDFAFSSISPLFELEPQDFILYGTTATVSVERYSVGFYVTASGGDLATLDDSVYVALGSSQHYDEYGNRLASTNPTGTFNNGYVIDNTAPTVVLDASTASVPGGPFTVSVEFSEAVDGFTADDLVVTNGSVTSFPSGSQNRFFYPTITPDGDGEVTIDLAADAITDVAGNGNEAAEQEVTRSDGTPPTITGVEFVTAGGSPTNSDTLTWEITVSEPVTHLNQYDFYVSGPGGTLTVTNPQPTLYVLEVSGAHIASYDGVATLQPSGAFQVYDLSVQLMQSAAVVGGGPAEWSVTVDHTAPGSSIQTDSLSVNGAFVARITPFEDSQPFTADDVTVTNGTITGFSLQGGTAYVTIQPVAEGQVIVQMLPGSFSDLAGNANTATSSLTVQYDATPPTLSSITRFSPTTEVTDADTLIWQVAFSESVTGVDASDFELAGANANLSVYAYRGGEGGEGAAMERAMRPGGGAAQTFQVEAFAGDIPDLDGTVTLSVSGSNNITDAAGLALAGTSPTGTNQNSFTLANDVTSPEVALTSDDTGPVSGPFTVTITFDEAVNGLEAGDFDVSNATITQFDGTDGDSVYTLTLTPVADGWVTVDLPAGAAADLAGNTSLAADQFSRLYDATAPQAAFSTTASEPVSGSFTLTVSFDEDVVGFALDDLDIVNATGSGLTGSGSVYSLEIEPDFAGTVTVDLAADSVTDTAGNGNLAASQFSMSVDNEAPGLVSIAIEDSGTTNGDSLSWLVTFSEVMANVDADDFDVDGVTGGVVSVADLGNGVYRVTVSGGDLAGLSGTVSLGLSATNDITDVAGNGLSSTTPSEPGEPGYTVDNTAPDVELVATATDPVTGAFTLSVQFSEGVTGLEVADFTVVNGSASDLAGSGSAFTIVITPSADGEVSVDLPSDVATDDAGNGNTAAQTFSIGADVTSPGVTLATASSDPVTGAFSLEVTFTEAVSGLSLDDFTASNASLSDLSGFGADYTVTVTPDGDGSINIDLPANAAQDDAGNGNTAAAQFSISADITRPDVALSTTSAEPVAGAFTLAVSFSEPVTGLTLDDFTASNAVLSDLSGSGADYTVTVTPDGDGSISIDLAANAAQDDAGNGNTAAAQFSISADLTRPVAVLSTTSTEPVAGAFTLAVSFSESVTGLALDDFTVGNGSASGLSGSGTDFTVLITPAADGDVSVVLVEGAVADAAGNTNAVSDTFTILADVTAPAVTLATASSDPVAGAFTLSVTFTETVSGLTLDDFTVDNGAASELTGSGQDYTVLITPAADGDVTVSLAAGAAVDAAGNGSAASQDFSILNDETGPTVVLASDVTLPVTGSFTLTVTFSEAVSGLELEDFVATSAELSDLAGEGAEYTVLVTPGTGSLLTVDLAADTVADAAGNANAEAETFSIVLDNTPPEPVITMPGEETEGVFTATITFSEDVTGFSLEDLTAENADLSEFVAVSAAEFTVSVTPRTLGTVSLSIAADVAQDAAGNGNTAASARIEAISRAIEVTVDVADDVEDPTQVTANASISNPGSEPVAFLVEVDVPWLDVDPMSGTIPSLGELELTITVNALVNDLEAGSYTGTITVINLDGDAIAKGAHATSQSESDSVVVAIPLTVTVAERRGTIQLVSTTPGGVQRDASFGFVSSDPDFDGLTLTTVGGSAATAPVRKLLGRYDVTQTLPQGWRLDTLSCVGDVDGGSVIDLAAGRVDIDLDANETIICTFANTRDEAEVRLATQRAIRNFMVRRADRILDAAPDLTSRIRGRETRSPGHVSADINGGSRMVSMGASLAGMRNHATDAAPQMPGAEATRTGRDTGMDVWLAASFSTLSDDRAGEGSDSAFGVLQVGADWALSEQTLVGVMLQRDWMDETATDIAERAGGIRGARVGGEGWLAGPYVVHTLADGVWFDALAMWGQSTNTIDPLGLYEDSFETDRYLLRLNLSGEWQAGAWRVRPSGSLAHFGETQAAYVDSLGIDIPEQEIAIGRFEAGPEVAYRFERPGGAWWEPSVRLTGVWDYNPAELLDESGALVGTGNTRLDARLGLVGQLGPGASIRLETDISGLGDGAFEARTGRLELSLSFN
jgi:hypothetical protein